MNEAQILQAIEPCCQDQTLQFQAIIQADLLHFYINREQVYYHHDDLVQEIASIIFALDPELQGIYFYSRILGEVEPDWKLFIAPEVAEVASITPEVLEPDPLEPDQVISEIPESDRLEINKSISEPESTLEPARPEITDYCFIRNQRLLNAELLAPKPEIAQIVNEFDLLPEEIRRSQLSDLKQYFLAADKPDLSQVNPQAQVWWQEVIELDTEQNKKLAIWLSRYCSDREQTIEAVNTVFAAQAEIAAALKTQSDNVNNDTNNPTEQQLNNPEIEEISSYSARSVPPSTSVNLLVPLGWLCATILITILGINSGNVEASSAEIPEICQYASRTPKYCHLAAQIIGTNNLTTALTNAAPPRPESLQTATSYCELYGNIAAGHPLEDADSRHNPLLKVETKEVFPGVYLVDVEQTSIKDRIEEPEATVRTACIFQQQSSESLYGSVELLGKDRINSDWPDVAYQPSQNLQSLQALNQALGAYSFFSNWGLNTLFTAVLIYLLAIMGMAVRANSIQTIYKASFVLGITESILGHLPVLGWWVQVPLACLALGITSGFVKGFSLDWTLGYRFVAATALILIVGRLLLNWLFLGFLFSVFS